MDTNGFGLRNIQVLRSEKDHKFEIKNAHISMYLPFIQL